MFPLSDSVLSVILKILSSTGDVNGINVCSVIALRRASAIAVLVDLAKTLTL